MEIIIVLIFSLDFLVKIINKEELTELEPQLKEIQTEISHDRYKRFVGTKQTLLVENYSKKTNKFMTGKIDVGHTTHISSKDIKIGDYVNVLITEASPFALKSELI